MEELMISWEDFPKWRKMSKLFGANEVILDQKQQLDITGEGRLDHVLTVLQEDDHITVLSTRKW